MSEFKLLTFLLGEESYGIPISRVKEIIGIHPITRIPHAPAFLKGIINLRGSVIHVVDLRLKLGLNEVPYNERTCILICNVSLDDKEESLGIIVDTVSEVLNISDENVEDPACCGRNPGEENDYIYGIGKLKDKNLIILDIAKMFQDSELPEMVEAAG